MKTPKITSKRELAQMLSEGMSVNVNNVSARLEKTLALWLRRKEVILSGSEITLKVR